MILTLKKNLRALILIFTIALIFQFIGLNKIGRTWDEQFKVDMGYLALKSISQSDFSQESWQEGEEHPMVAKYIYALAAKPYIKELNPKATSAVQVVKLLQNNYIIGQVGEYFIATPYDFLGPRFLSSIFNAISVALVYLLARRFLDKFWSVTAALTLLFIPRFVVMGQLITYESLSLMLYLAAFFSFSMVISNYHKAKYFILLGIIIGLLFWTRYNNITIIIFLAGWWGWEVYKKKIEILNSRLLIVPTLAFLLGIAIWPLMWIEFPKYLILSFAQNSERAIGLNVYYLNYFLLTTPIPILFGLILGLFRTVKEKKFLPILLCWWLVSTLVFYSLLGVEGGGTRYAFAAYAPIVLLCAYGFSVLLKKKWKYLLIPIALFMIWDMSHAFPYYLDYYNHFAGGTKGAFEKGLSVSWWGEGQREAVLWLNKNAKQDASVGFIVTPKYVAPNLRMDLENLQYISEKEKPDYIVSSLHEYNSLSTDYKNNYSIVYKVQSNSQTLMYVLKRNSL